ncbi:MAG TPA: hypothetical protein VII00_00755 [bacterium]
MIPFLRIIFFIIFFAALPSCGKKGIPLPPLTIIPAAITDVKTVIRDEGIYIIWTPPTKNIDDSPLENLKGFKILRSESPVGLTCEKCLEIFAPMYDVFNSYPSEGAGEIESGGFKVFDNNLKERMRYRYKIISYNRYGYLSPDSNITEAVWDTPPAPPSSISGESGDHYNLIQWKPPDNSVNGDPLHNIVGYNIYRAEKSDFYSIFSINSEPIQFKYYMDANLENYKQYYYIVRSVRLVEGSFIESAPSREIVLTPKDTTPPPPPHGVIAIPEQNGISLKWEQGLESDLEGYNIYRSISEKKGWSKLNPKPLKTTEFSDRTVTRKVIYFYRLTAVDNSPFQNESEPSKIIKVFWR